LDWHRTPFFPDTITEYFSRAETVRPQFLNLRQVLMRFVFVFLYRTNGKKP